MNKTNAGYTLVELMVTVTLIVIVLTGGTAIFYRSFQSSSVSDTQTVLNNSLKSLDGMLERTLRYGSVVRLVGADGEKLRTECLLGGASGVSGSTLVVKDNQGASITYSLLANGTVSSNSGVIISNPGIYVTNLRFTWYCRSGVSDKLNLLIEATSSAITGERAESIIDRDIVLFNSGIN